MENKKCALLPSMDFLIILTIACMLSFSPTIAQEAKSSWESNDGNLETYIVLLNQPNRHVFAHSEDLESWYHSFLPATTTSFNKQSRMVYSYRNVITGFAAKLSPQEAKALEKKDGFVSARPQKVLPLHTTHSPSFLGLHQNLGFWQGSNYGKGVIIGVLDTGITPSHPSFSDEGVPPPPAKWKGKCELNGTVCNNKLIGARNFVSGSTEPPIDEEGHGTHTSSIAAGNYVEGANIFGLANGTAAGMAPLAHLAIYKVCDETGCGESDILAAMDTAIEDGVDVLSLSLGGGSSPFFADVIAVGAFGAIQKGIFVSCSAGNSGPFNASLSNEAPWILTVGASTIDRSMRATALLGNKDLLDGESFFQPKDFPVDLLPLVYAGKNGDQNAALCGPGSLNNTDIQGKVVLCERGGGIARIAKGQTVKDAGGAAMILMNQQQNGNITIADFHVLPATHVGYDAGQVIKAYINSTSSPMATIIFKGTVFGVGYAPMVASFSSRGPSLASPGILKPDIIGPGVSILAAWPGSVEHNNNTIATFAMLSGTSMSCPHLSGIAALLKNTHPDWSPAAIKSAIMTTADQFNLDKMPIIDERSLPADIFALGAGHIYPSKANDPGLVYDIQPDDYIPYLCGLGYTDQNVSVIVQRPINCSQVSSILEAELNYPSFAIALGSTAQTYTRTVTNVGQANSSYYPAIYEVRGVVVSVKPLRLDFTEVNEKLTYQVTFTRSANSGLSVSYVQGALVWISGKYYIRSPISVKLE